MSVIDGKILLTKSDCYKANKKMTPKGIVVHSTGANNPNLKRYIQPDDGNLGTNSNGNDWNRSGLTTCVHGFIGKDKNGNVKFYQTLPFDICCWGVGQGSKGSYNYSPAYIQFEMCEDGLTDKSYCTKVYNKAVEVCAYLCKTYNISVSNIVGHYEAYQKGYGSNHGDPKNWWSKHGYTMSGFRSAVTKAMSSTTTTSTTSTTSTSSTSTSSTSTSSTSSTTTTTGTSVKVINKTSCLRSQSYVDDTYKTSKKLKTLNVGTSLTWISDDGYGWSKCKAADGTTGWIQNTRINKSGLSKYPLATVTGNSVRIRKAPNGTIIKLVNKGTTFTAYYQITSGTNKNWTAISVSGQSSDCFISSDYVKLTKRK